ncbi:MAG: hypothetical protein IJS49_00935 [Paludibacteraceae bacterium]|nr:hypothetical protein [Paludibacteraceae bacterium]
MKTQARHITIRLWALLLMVGACACNPWEQPEEEKDIPLAIFKTFWEQMDKRYTCFEEHHVNWDSIYYTNISQVNELQNTEDLVPIFQSIMNTLKDPQLWIGVPQKASIQYRLNGSLESHGITTAKGTDFFIDNKNEEYLQSHQIYALRLSHKCEDKEFHFGYVSASSFRNKNATIYQPLLEQVAQLQPDGIIVDLRYNNKGEFPTMIEFVRQFYEGNRPILYTVQRESEENRYNMTHPEPYSIVGEGTVPDSIPIIVIVNYFVMGPANVCAYILQALPNTIVIGQTTTSGGGSSISGASLTHDWTLHFSNDVKYYVNWHSCESPLRLNVVVSESSAIHKEYIIDGHKEVLFIDSSIATAISLLESLSQE